VGFLLSPELESCTTTTTTTNSNAAASTTCPNVDYASLQVLAVVDVLQDLVCRGIRAAETAGEKEVVAAGILLKTNANLAVETQPMLSKNTVTQKSIVEAPKKSSGLLGILSNFYRQPQAVVRQQPEFSENVSGSEPEPEITIKSTNPNLEIPAFLRRQ
jgi:hypothetical protein